MWHGKNQNNGKSNVFNIVHFRAKNIAFEGIFKNDHENNEFKKTIFASKIYCIMNY